MSAAANYIGNAADFEYSLTCLGAGYVGGPTMVRHAQAQHTLVTQGMQAESTKAARRRRKRVVANMHLVVA